jgi:hypothetical protein
MKTEYTFPLHSFVNLITNSSSEIFVEATKATKKSVQEIVDLLLKEGGSTKTCADVFQISLIIPKGTYNPNWEEDAEGDEDVSEELEKDLDAESKEGKAFIEANRDSDRPFTNVKLKVKAKLDDPDTAKAAKLLENFISTFEINEYQD